MSSSCTIAWATLLAATLLTGCGDKTPAGFTGRVGADFRAELDVTLDGVPLHLVHNDRCLEYRMGTGFATDLSYDPNMLSDIGGFSARQGRWRLLSVAPNLCQVFDDWHGLYQLLPPDRQSAVPPRSLSPDYLPLLALLPDDGGPLRLYLSAKALNRPGDPLRYGAMTGMIPASGGPAANTEPLPLRAMLHGTVPGVCYRGWMLSPAEPKDWSAMPEVMAFMAAATRPILVPDKVAAQLDPQYAKPWATIWELFPQTVEPRDIPFVVNAESFVVQGARSLASVHRVYEGLFFDTDTFKDWGDWRYPKKSMVSALTGRGLPRPTHSPWTGPETSRPSVIEAWPEHLIPLRRTGAAYKPAPEERGLAEAWPGDAQCGEPLAGEIPVALGRDVLTLRPFAIFAWPEAGTFLRLVPVDIRLPN